MDAKDYQLLKSYQDKSFKEVNRILYRQFFLYNLILIGFTVMSLSFLNGFQYLFVNRENFAITILVLLPIIYLMIKSIYGLILLQDGYSRYHYQLIYEYPILYILGYNIILLTILDHQVIYLYESCLIVLTGILFKKFKNEIIIILTILITIGMFYYLSFHTMINIYLVILTYVVSLFFVTPFVFILYPTLDKEIKALQVGYKNCPDKLIKEIISII